MRTLLHLAIGSFAGFAGFVGSACTVAPTASGRPCANDGACGAGFYCQLEIEPQVCIPGALGLPSLPNFPPQIERALVIVPIGLPDDDGNVPLVHSGRFAARDPEGQDPETITFAIDLADREGPLGQLDVAANGGWTFTLATPLPVSEATATHRVRAIDAQGNVGVADALVVVVPQPPSEFLSYWVGVDDATAAGTSVADASSWNPARVPDAERSVAVGPGARGGLDIDVDTEVFGWLSTDAVPVTMRDTAVTVHGTRILSDSVLEDGRFIATPVGNFDVEVQLAGQLPSLELQGSARAIAPVHIAGDLALAGGVSSTGGVVRLEADVSVDGNVTQAADGAALLMQGGAFRVGGDLVLTGATKSVITAGLLDVGGALDAPDATFGGPDLLVRFASSTLTDDAARGLVATVRLPEGARIGNAHVAKSAAVVLTSALVVEGTMQLSGGVRVEAPVVVDTLVVRPSFLDLGAEGAGSLTARVCFVAPFVATPSWLACDVQNIAPPLDRPDAGPGEEPSPDPGPPSVCSRLNADVVTDAGIAGIAGDNMEHGLVVANAGGDPVTDRFSFDGLALAASSSAVRGGALDVANDGAFTFTPNAIAGVEGLDVAMDVGIRNDDGTALIAGTQEACIDVQIVDVAGMNVMIGFSWDDPAAWTFGRVPTAQDRVFIPASPRARLAADVGDDLVARELYVSSGAVLYTGARTMRVVDVVLVGGTLDASVVIGPPTRDTAAIGGRIAAAGAGLGPSSAALVCGGGKARLVADVDTTTIRSEQPCEFTVGQHRLTARNDVALAHTLGLRMSDDFGAVVFAGDLAALALGDEDSFLNRGELQFHGLIELGAWIAASSEGHRALVSGQGDITIDAIDYAGFLTVRSDSEGSLTFANGGHVGRLFALRDVRVTTPGAELFVDELQMNPLFTTTTDPARFRVGQCLPRNQHPACLNPP